ncbi:33941_t:CDS:2, partial [Racocetra persica]
DISSVKSHDDRSSSENSVKNGNSVTNCDDRQKNIPVITTSQENNDDDIEFTKSQVVEQELTKELLSAEVTTFHAFNSKDKVSISSDSSPENDQDLKLPKVEVNTSTKDTEDEDDNKESSDDDNSENEGSFNNNEDNRGFC